MQEFKVGDIVRGKKDSRCPYGVTDEEMKKAKVTEVEGDRITIEVMEHKDDCWAGTNFRVYSKYFELVDDKKAFKVGDIVCGVEDSIYGITDDDMTKAIIEEIDHDDDEMTIRILEHKNSEEVGRAFEVYPKYFDLVESPEIKEEITISLEKDKKSVLMVYKRDNTAVREELFKLGDGISFMDAAKDILDNFDNDRIEYSLSSLEDTKNAITWESQEEFIELMDRIFGGDNGNDLALYIEDGTIVIDDMDFLDMGGYNFINYSKVTMD